MKKPISFILVTLILLLSGCLESATIDETLYLGADPPIILVDEGKVWVEFRPDLDPTLLFKNAVPTMIERGTKVGYSLPVVGVDEELFYNICVPNGWDGESDLYVHIYAWLDSPQDEAEDAVLLSLTWSTYHDITEFDTSDGDDVEIVVGDAPQFTAIKFTFIVPYDGIVPIASGEIIAFHLERNTSSHEMAGEPVIYHAGVIFQFDKIGNPTYE